MHPENFPSQQPQWRPPKVSVLMISYNHEAYIAQAIDSVLAQTTDFDVEIVIGEDCSTDGTRRIALDYQRRHPGRIRVLAREKNLGMLPNLVDTYQNCRGQYIALLEGDDYWCDPLKLKSQVELLDARSDFAICFHNVAVVGDRSDGFPAQLCRNVPEVSTIEDLAFQLYIPTCSVVLRNGLIPEFPAWFYKLGMGDWPLLLLAAQQGRIWYFDKIMAHYRRHPGGIWSSESNSRNSEKLLDAVNILNQALGHKFDSIFCAQECWCWCDLAVKCDRQNRHEEAVRFRRLARHRALRSFPQLLRLGWSPTRLKLNMLFRLFFPRTWKTIQSLRNCIFRRGTSMASRNA
jgi:glycosyltransferase involved in cell wall biosynthesis